MIRINVWQRIWPDLMFLISLPAVDIASGCLGRTRKLVPEIALISVAMAYARPPRRLPARVAAIAQPLPLLQAVATATAKEMRTA